MAKCLRKRFAAQETWHDKSAPKHKHEYVINCILELRVPATNGRLDDYQITYMSALMCSKCHSFTSSRDIVKDKIFKITNKLEEDKKKILPEEVEKIPRIIAYKNNYILNSTDYQKIIFFDNYEYNKK